MTNEITHFVAPSNGRLKVMRQGHSLIRSQKIPKPIVIVDTREKEPLPIYEKHPNWIAGERRGTLKTGDYTVEGMGSVLCLEHKSLPDLVACTVSYRQRFIDSCHRLAGVHSGPPARPDLKKKAISHLRMLQKKPKPVMKYFNHPKIRYAA
jgi:hypothetical protein